MLALLRPHLRIVALSSLLPAAAFADAPSKPVFLTLPGGFSYGFEYNLSNTRFALVDLNGDGVPDLLDAENEATDADDTFTDAGHPTWHVYLGSRAGFVSAPLAWRIPPNFACGLEYDLANDEFALVDMDGDGRPDLIDLENEATPLDDDVFDEGVKPSWRVYRNIGTSFADEPLVWALPGAFENGYEFRLMGDPWRLIDVNGDKRPDLLDAENEATNPTDDTFTTPGGRPAWRVYANTGTGFAP